MLRMLKYQRRLAAISFAVLFLVCSAYSQDPLKTPDVKPDYSKEAFVDEEDLTKISFENDGTSTKEQVARLRIQSDAGVQRYGVLTFSYESAAENIDLDYIRVRHQDGSLITTPAENVQDMPTEVTRQAPFYSDVREKHVAVKGLGVGDTLEWHAFWRKSKPLAPGQFWTAFNFSHDVIVLHQQVKISVPQDRVVKWKSPSLKPEIREEGTRRIFTWTTSQLEHRSDEDDKKEKEKTAYEAVRGKLPPPDVMLSSFQSWEEIGAWYNGLQTERVKPGADIRAKAAELTNGAVDDDAKLRAIYNYVSTQFHYIGVAFGIGRYQPHSADEILANQYGDCKDKHTLLASLLDAAGIKAYPALISSARAIDPDVPSPAQFDHVITAVPGPKDILWLDATAEVAPFGYLLPGLRDKSALLVTEAKPATLVTTAAELPYKSEKTFKVKAKLDDSGTLDGKVEVSNRGDLELMLRLAFRRVPQVQWQELVQSISNYAGFSGTVSNVTASFPESTNEAFHFAYSYNRKEYSDWKDHQITPPLPPILLPDSDDNGKKPTEPVWFGSPGESVLQADVELPVMYSPRLPSPVDVKRTFGEYHSRYEWTNGALHAERRLILSVEEIPLTQYDEYKSFCKAVADDEERYITLSSGFDAAQKNMMVSMTNDLWALPDSKNDDAMLSEGQAKHAMQQGDLHAAVDDLKRAVAADPKFTRDWELLGTVLAGLRKPEESLDALRKGAQVDPKQAFPQKTLALALMSMQKYMEVVPVWQTYLQDKPEDGEADQALGFALRTLKRYPESAAAYEAAFKLNPEQYRIELEMGTSYLLSGDETKAMTTYQEILSEHPETEMFNDVGYELADAGKQLPLALQYTERAVREQEEKSAQVKLSDLKVEDLGITANLGAYWDSLGWAHYRLGDYDVAEKYLLAAWSLSQGSAEEKHLTEVNQHQAKHPSAASGDRNLLRTTKLPRLISGTANAEVFVTLVRGTEPSTAKVEDVRFISGSESLRDSTESLKKTSFRFPFPDDGPSHLVRRGIIGCYPVTGCNFVVYNVGDVRSIN